MAPIPPAVVFCWNPRQSSAGGRRAVAVGVAVSVAVAGYLLGALAEIVDALEPWQVLSPFDWMDKPIRHGAGAGAVALAAASAACVLAAIAAFDRRDLGV